MRTFNSVEEVMEAVAELRDALRACGQEEACQRLSDALETFYTTATEALGELHDAVEETELPSALREMAPEARQSLVDKMAKKREEIVAELKDLVTKRDAYLASEVVATEAAGESLDYQVYETIREQAKEKGLDYKPAAPKL